MIGGVSALDLARDLIAHAIAAGVREIVVCPGSRSAPLAYAAYAAEQAGLVRLHVRVDERSAGFLALGLAKTSRIPALLVTTSGTAVANLHPAVLEAHHGKVPMIVASADRPAALRGSGANQTTIQPGIFPHAVRFAADLDQDADPGDDPDAVVRAAYAAAVGHCAAGAATAVRDPGPVHLNICLAEPLVPSQWPPAEREREQERERSPEGEREGEPAPEGERDDTLAEWPTVGVATPAVLGQAEHARRAAQASERTLVVLGDLVDGRDRPAALAWAARRGYPVIAEPFGAHQDDAGVLPHGPLLLTDPAFLDANPPDRVVVIGRPTLSRPVSALLRRPGLLVAALTDTATPADPQGVVTQVADLRATLAADPDRADPDRADPNGADPDRADPDRADPDGTEPGRVGSPPSRASWAGTWWAAGERVAAAVRAEPSAWPSGLALAQTLIASLPPTAILFTGPSNPVRDIDIGVCRVPPGRTIVASRGLAGIDGCLATAIGIALAEPGRPAYALLGDLTFLHDSGGLLIGPGEPRPDLTIVVGNDRGGGIFGLLEPGRPALAEPYERLFATPTMTDLGALARAHGIRHEVAHSDAELARALADPPHGLRVVEVPLERATHAAAHAQLRAVAAAALRPA